MPSILSTTPASFSGLTPEEARWTPLVVLVKLDVGDTLGINYYEDDGAIWVAVYTDSKGLAPFYQGKSTVVQQVDPTQFLCTLLPNGGWNTPDFEIKFFSQLEAV